MSSENLKDDKEEFESAGAEYENARCTLYFALVTLFEFRPRILEA